MDIGAIVSDEFVSFDAETPASKVAGAFDDPVTKAVVVTDDGAYAGLVTAKQFGSTHRTPSTKARTLCWHVARAAPDDDIRTVARLMVDSDAKALPVFEDGDLVGVVTAEDLLAEVREHLDALAVSDVYTESLQTVSRRTSVGEALHLLREHHITHLPVVDGDTVVGIVSQQDLVDFSARKMDRASGGNSPRFDAHGGRGRGGYGSRSGEIQRMLDLPVENAMSRPVLAVEPDAPLGGAVETMLENGVSSLIVEDGGPAGIVTKTDVLRALTWTDEDRLPVQIIGVDLLDDCVPQDVTEMVEAVAGKHRRMRVYEAVAHLHKHDEKLRGTPLLQARVRLLTDKGHFVGTAEGYGASHALGLACDILERSIIDEKTFDRSKKPLDPEERAKVRGHL
ncbi:CBS domain-containing protein [Natronomonas sp. EA1]|uniref:CBS domain-containing protein n=1 Tax=Natronomonas sp. EA1 TaxID=3421655 RepID=UPI003EC14D6B